VLTPLTEPDVHSNLDPSPDASPDASPDPRPDASPDASPNPALDPDQRRFASVERLIGGEGLASLRRAHVVVVGLGGVGSWAAEALARSGVGRLTLIDLDHVAQSNLNRQLLATLATLGAAKVLAMRERILSIVADCQVVAVDAMVTPDTVDTLLPLDADVVLDAIDAPRSKAAMIACARARKQAIVVCGAAGGRSDPLALRRDDLADITGDRLLAAVRSRLRRDYGFPPPGRSFGVTGLSLSTPAAGGSVGGAISNPSLRVVPRDTRGTAPLACAGYGSIVTVTATMGFAAAAAAIDYCRGNDRQT